MQLKNFACVCVRPHVCVCVQKIKHPDASRHKRISASRRVFCSRTFGMYYRWLHLQWVCCSSVETSTNVLHSCRSRSDQSGFSWTTFQQLNDVIIITQVIIVGVPVPPCMCATVDVASLWMSVSVSHECEAPTLSMQILARTSICTTIHVCMLFEVKQKYSIFNACITLSQK